MLPRSILHLVINLPSSPDRKEKIIKQAETLGLDILFIEAISGKDLDMNELPHFDRKRRDRSHALEMKANEHACLSSHLKALTTFLQSEVSFCTVSEDDVIFDKDFMEKTNFLISHTEGWDYIKLLNEGIHYPLASYSSESGADYLTLTFPKNLSFCSNCILYTKKGARNVLKHFDHYWNPFDTQLGYISCKKQLIGLSLLPPLVTLDKGLESDIGHSKRNLHRTGTQWLNHRVERFVNSYRKRKLLRFIRKKFNAKPLPPVLCRV